MFAKFFIHILASKEDGRKKMAQPQQPNPPPQFTMIDSKGEEFLQVCSFKAILFTMMKMVTMMREFSTSFK